MNKQKLTALAARISRPAMMFTIFMICMGLSQQSKADLYARYEFENVYMDDEYDVYDVNPYYDVLAQYVTADAYLRLYSDDGLSISADYNHAKDTIWVREDRFPCAGIGNCTPVTTDLGFIVDTNSPWPYDNFESARDKVVSRFDYVGTNTFAFRWEVINDMSIVPSYFAEPSIGAYW